MGIILLLSADELVTQGFQVYTFGGLKRHGINTADGRTLG